MTQAGSRESASRSPSTGTDTKSKRVKNEAPYAVISRRAAERIHAGHVWVYQSDIERIVAPRAEVPTRLLQVVDPRGLTLGTALYSEHSQISLRLVSTAVLDERSWMQLFRDRLAAAIDLRRGISTKQHGGTDSCRLVFSEADLLPGLIADQYGDLVVFQIQTAGMDTAEIRRVFLEVVIDALAPRAVFERTDSRIAGLERITSSLEAPLFLREAASSAPAAVFHLNGLSFHYNANLGQKTGSFLDQRENYAAAARYCRGEALDVCTYQGGFALHLARHCARVTGIDASRPALEVAEQNLVLNQDVLGGAEVNWVEANAFDVLREWSDAGKKFDSIVLDPPAFAKSKRAAEGALRGYKELNLRALKMLRQGGTLVTCSCSYHVGVEDFTAVVRSAAADARRSVQLLERRGAAPDHPVLLGVPETEYLKCLISRVT